MENEQVFDNDIASRYAEARTPVKSWRDREAGIVKEIGESPDKTVASFVWNFDKSYNNNLVSLIRAKKFAEAKQYRDGMVKAIEANRDAIGVLTQIGDVGGPASAELAKRANSVFQYGFDDIDVDMPDGTKEKVGEILQDGSAYLGMKSNDLVNLGFSGKTAGMYLGGSDLQKRVFGGIIDPFVQVANRGKMATGAPVVPNHQQLNDLADDLSTNWDVFEGTFGEDGLASVVDFVRTSHETSGNASSTLRALTEFAANYQDGSMSGADLARTVINGYKGLLNFTMGGDAVKDGHPVELTDNQRRTFDAIMVPAVKELSRRVGKFDLEDPRLRAAMLEVADAQAYATAAGVDMFRNSRDTKNTINSDFAKYVADRMTDTEPDSGNIVTAMRNLRSFLDSTIQGGKDAQLLKMQMTGQSRDYLASVDKANGKKSSSPALDDMELDVKQYLTRTLAPHLAGGARADDAIEYLLDDDERRGAFMSGLAGAMAGYFHGEGRDHVASVLANSVMERLAPKRFAGTDGTVREGLGGQKFSFQEIIENMLVDPSYPEDDPSRKTLSSWYYGNITAADSFGPHLAEIEGHLKDQGLGEGKARMLTAKAAERMASAVRNGLSPATVKDSIMSVGRMFMPRFDGGKLVAIDSVPANLDKTPFDIVNDEGKQETVPAGFRKANPVAWAQLQDWCRQMKPEIDRQRIAAEKERLSREKEDIRFERRKEMAEYNHRLRAQDQGFGGFEEEGADQLQ